MNKIIVFGRASTLTLGFFNLGIEQIFGEVRPGIYYE